MYYFLFSWEYSFSKVFFFFLKKINPLFLIISFYIHTRSRARIEEQIKADFRLQEAVPTPRQHLLITHKGIWSRLIPDAWGVTKRKCLRNHPVFPLIPHMRRATHLKKALCHISSSWKREVNTLSYTRNVVIRNSKHKRVFHTFKYELFY